MQKRLNHTHHLRALAPEYVDPLIAAAATRMTICAQAIPLRMTIIVSTCRVVMNSPYELGPLAEKGIQFL